MLSYRHCYHAGNHADVLKHIVLSLCLDHLKQKEKPFIYLDTHAGAGRYQLTSSQAAKNNEYLSGIHRLWLAKEKPLILNTYLATIKFFNKNKQLKYYPGSPLIAKNLLRSDDRIILTELHPTDFQLLNHEFLNDKRAVVKKEDGYHQLKSKLPPKEKRGIILIDPTYELKSDYKKAIQTLKEGYKRFSTGIYILWYPVVSRPRTERMIGDLATANIKYMLQIEMSVRPDNTQKGMTSSGLVIINPPWQLKTQMKYLLPWLNITLVPEGTGSYAIKENFWPDKRH